MDTEAVTEYAKSLPGVEYAFSPMFACSTDQQQEIKRAIEEHKLNRFVVASCTPRTHEPLFRNTLREAGLNPYFSSLQISASTTHGFIRGAWACNRKGKRPGSHGGIQVSLLEPLYDFSYEVVQKALVIGGGLAGLTAALSVAEQGFSAVLIEKIPELSGDARKLFYTEDGGDPKKYLAKLVKSVKYNEFIKRYREAEV